jgi:hypothetical protein
VPHLTDGRWANPQRFSLLTTTRVTVDVCGGCRFCLTRQLGERSVQDLLQTPSSHGRFLRLRSAPLLAQSRRLLNRSSRSAETIKMSAAIKNPMPGSLVAANGSIAKPSVARPPAEYTSLPCLSGLLQCRSMRSTSISNVGHRHDPGDPTWLATDGYAAVTAPEHTGLVMYAAGPARSTTAHRCTGTRRSPAVVVAAGPRLHATIVDYCSAL